MPVFYPPDSSMPTLVCCRIPDMDLPRRLFVEVTTRCNIECAMCVKQSTGCLFPEGDMSRETFFRLKTALETADALILNGVGEPLLNPHLPEFVAMASEWMPADSRIGFQTNGQLLSRAVLGQLVDAGLNLISFSVDAADESVFGSVRAGAELSGVVESLDYCSELRSENPDLNLEVGVESVLQRSTMARLPETLRWAATRGVDFALVSHLLPYDETSRREAVFDRCTDRALRHFRKWKVKADAEGLHLPDYSRSRWKYLQDDYDRRLSDFVDTMVKDAYENDVYFHMKNHLDRDDELQDRLELILEECRKVSEETGLRLELPSSAPTADRHCEFMEEPSLFVSWSGQVHPCYFLWHSYSSFVSDWRKHVTARGFGRLADSDPAAIWNSRDFVDFRNQASSYDYPICTNCTVAPCNYIDSEEFEQDCHTNTVPCGDCQWCQGLFQCLT